jgi:diaminopimelate decarboxylase
MFNVESSDELREIDRVAGSMRVKAPIALRINPDIDPRTHPYISTGMKEHKFGIALEDALEHYALASRLKHVTVVGVQKHIGCRCHEEDPHPP